MREVKDRVLDILTVRGLLALMFGFATAREIYLNRADALDLGMATVILGGYGIVKAGEAVVNRNKPDYAMAAPTPVPDSMTPEQLAERRATDPYWINQELQNKKLAAEVELVERDLATRRERDAAMQSLLIRKDSEGYPPPAGVPEVVVAQPETPFSR